jgi:DNA-binding response OmpR family regulator
VTRGGKTIELSKTEFDLLEYLVLNHDLVQSREQILNRVWGYNYYGNYNIVDVYIKYLRDKIDKDFETKLIHTVRGRGYVVK